MELRAMMKTSADFANFARIPTLADIAALRALGVTRVIVGSSWGTKAADQMAACEAAGFDVQEYQFPEALKPSRAHEWWLDVEISPFHVPTREEVRAAMQAVPQPIGAYTSKSQWDALWPNWDIVAEFPWLRLWTANYGALPRPFTPYGGWTKADMTQYQGTTDIGTGFEVDLSEYEEDAMTPDEEARVAALEKTVKDLQLIALRDALRANAAEVHQHGSTLTLAGEYKTSGPVAP